MAKIKLTKGELKKQRDALRQYERYLPTLQLKKQQLQMEILRQTGLVEDKRSTASFKARAAESWSSLLVEFETIRDWLVDRSVVISKKNIAGVDIPLFGGVGFAAVEYDLFSLPLWVDKGYEALKELASLQEEIAVLEKGIEILRRELRITTQRVNLFEKVKIPETEEAIRIIKIYIGDQMANAVGRSKIAKRKIEALEQEVPV